MRYQLRYVRDGEPERHEATAHQTVKDSRSANGASNLGTLGLHPLPQPGDLLGQLVERTVVLDDGP